MIACDSPGLKALDAQAGFCRPCGAFPMCDWQVPGAYAPRLRGAAPVGAVRLGVRVRGARGGGFNAFGVETSRLKLGFIVGVARGIITTREGGVGDGFRGGIKIGRAMLLRASSVRGRVNTSGSAGASPSHTSPFQVLKLPSETPAVVLRRGTAESVLSRAVGSWYLAGLPFFHSPVRRGRTVVATGGRGSAFRSPLRFAASG